MSYNDFCNGNNRSSQNDKIFPKKLLQTFDIFQMLDVKHDHKSIILMVFEAIEQNITKCYPKTLKMYNLTTTGQFTLLQMLNKNNCNFYFYSK